MNIRIMLTTILLSCMALFSCGSDSNNSSGGGSGEPETPTVTSEVNLYVTTASRSMAMEQVPLNFNTKPNMSPTTITLNPAEIYQEMEGFGVAITGSSCYNLKCMTAANRTKLLKETFDTKDGLGYSYIRIAIGCSDFSLSEYTYCDTKGIENFSLQAEDKEFILPILKEILAINPNIKILASPWTCPKWMKVKSLSDRTPYDSWTSGQLNPDYYADYATYFVKFIQAMKAEGVDITSVTLQNEPLNRGNSASLYMTWQEQRDFVKIALGPKFREAGIQSKIIVFDHNYNYDNIADQKNYPLNIYADADAAQYIDGAAYHAYGGDKSELLNIHNGRTDKGLYFTEISIGLWGSGYTFADDLMWNMREVCLGTINNWCKAVMVWNFMLDDKHAPYRPGGCSECLGAIDISSKDYSTMTKNSHYYTMGHLSKVIATGAKRIGTSGYKANGLYYSAFQNPDGSYAVVLQNDTNGSMKITLAEGSHSFTYEIPGKAIASYKWK